MNYEMGCGNNVLCKTVPETDLGITINYNMEDDVEWKRLRYCDVSDKYNIIKKCFWMYLSVKKQLDRV